MAETPKKIAPVFGKTVDIKGGHRNSVLVNLPAKNSSGDTVDAPAVLPIDNLMTISLSKEFSAMITPCGMQVPVKLSLAELEKALAGAYGRIDLSLVTGMKISGSVPKITLLSTADAVNNLTQSDAPPKIDDDQIEIRLFAFDDEKPMERRLLTFKVSEIDWQWQDYSKPSKAYLKLKNKQFFKIKGFFIDMPKQDFMARLNLMQMKGVGLLDLCEETRVKVPESKKPFKKG